VDGVPFFIINGKVTLSGAQQPEVFLEAIRKAVGGK
jgi:predicted DsbA family dithiol-disulfide isomerase